MSLGQSIPTALTSAPAAAADRAGTHATPAGDHSWGRMFAGIGVYIGICWIVDAVMIRVLPDEPTTRFLGGGVVLVILLAILSWPARLRLAVLHALSMIQFAVSLLAVVGLATVAGTWILQGERLESYQANYGNTFTDVIFELGLNDLFHSLWFGGLLVLLAFSLLVTIYRHKAWRLPTLGLFLSHFGVITIVAGGLTGYAGGFKGFIDLHEGEATQSAALTRHGRPVGGAQSFDFALRLDKFEIEKYPAKNKLYLYRQAGETYRPLLAVEPVPAEKWTAVPGTGSSFRVRQLYPDFVMESRLEPVAPTAAPIGPILPDHQQPPAGLPGAEVRVRVGEQAHFVALCGGASDKLQLTERGPTLRYCSIAPTSAGMADWSKVQPAQHRLIVKNAAAAGTPPETITVELGHTYPFGAANQVEVLQFLPDFSYNLETKEAFTRTNAPNNPGLLVRITRLGEPTAPPQWLFANMPDFSMGKGGTMIQDLPLAYSFAPGRAGELQSFVIVAESQELLEVRAGTVVNRRPLTPNLLITPDLELVATKLLPCARANRHPASQSTAMINPVVELEVRNGTEITTQLLSTNHAEPYAFADGKSLLSFEAGADEVKSYRSHVSILENGLAVQSAVIAVNQPLEYKGMQFYQSNYRKEDPTYSGFQVVHDPGLPLIWGGLIMISLGVVYNYYLRPRLMGRQPHDA
ncbi:MAG TPA: cytochrome c biogenesis protein ResB [Planctomycetota bacterium]|nr:cytochrome c biogenesis protein ResB [Planctomycetota bacterium]